MRSSSSAYAVAAVSLMMVLASCASVPQPKTPAQTVYAMQGEYAAALTVLVKYRQLPPCPATPACSDPAVVRHIQDFDTQAYTALMDAEDAVRQGLSPDVVTKLLGDAAAALQHFETATSEVNK